MKKYLSVTIFFLIFITLPALVFSAENPPEPGDILPDFTFEAPLNEEEQRYLGIEDKDSFRLEELEADFFLIEVVGMYCPICHLQSEEVNRLFEKITADEHLAKKMLMFSIASGSPDREIDYLKNTWQAPYPILPDYDFDFFNTIGNPGVPFTLIVSRDREIHYTNTGRMPDLSEYIERIREIVR